MPVGGLGTTAHVGARRLCWEDEASIAYNRRVAGYVHETGRMSGSEWDSGG